MPEFFRHPSQDRNTTNSGVYVFTGKGTIFGGDKGMTLDEIRDGTSNTILAVSTPRDVHWAKPEDIEFSNANRDAIFEALNIAEEGIKAAICDGSVIDLPKNITADDLRNFVLCSDGRVVDWYNLINKQ